jgi:hypothetical protein
MNIEQLKEFVCLETRKRELDSELKAIAARIDDLEQALVPQFLADGVASMKVDGRTVYVARTFTPVLPTTAPKSSPRSSAPSLASTSRRTTTRSHCERSCAKSPKRTPW